MYDYINFVCQLSTSPGVYQSLTDCENAVNNGSAIPVLQLTPLWNISKKAQIPLTISKLGDNYKQVVYEGLIDNQDWEITSPCFTQVRLEALIQQLTEYLVNGFLWSPSDIFDYAIYACDDWKISRLGIDQYQLSTTFRKLSEYN